MKIFPQISFLALFPLFALSVLSNLYGEPSNLEDYKIFYDLGNAQENIIISSFKTKGEIFQENTITTFDLLYNQYHYYASPWNILLDPFDVDLIVKYTDSYDDFLVEDKGIKLFFIKSFNTK